MRVLLLGLVASAFLSGTGNAQTMTVHLRDGRDVQYAIADIRSITYEPEATDVRGLASAFVGPQRWILESNPEGDLEFVVEGDRVVGTIYGNRLEGTATGSHIEFRRFSNANQYWRGELDPSSSVIRFVFTYPSGRQELTARRRPEAASFQGTTRWTLQSNPPGLLELTVLSNRVVGTIYGNRLDGTVDGTRIEFRRFSNANQTWRGELSQSGDRIHFVFTYPGGRQELDATRQP